MDKTTLSSVETLQYHQNMNVQKIVCDLLNETSKVGGIFPVCMNFDTSQLETRQPGIDITRQYRPRPLTSLSSGPSQRDRVSFLTSPSSGAGQRAGWFPYPPP